MLKHDDEVEGNHNFLHLHPLSLCKNFVKMHEKSSKHATKITKTTTTIISFNRCSSQVIVLHIWLEFQKEIFFFGLVMKLILLLINFYTMTKLLFLSIWLKTYLVTTTQIMTICDIELYYLRTQLSPILCHKMSHI